MGWFSDLVERLKTEQAGNMPAENAAPVETVMEDLTAEVEARPSTEAIPTEETDVFSSITDPKVRAYMRKQMEERKIAQQQADENKRKVDLWRLPFQMAGAVAEGAARKPVGTYTPSWEKQYEEANRPLRDIEERQKAEMGALGREATAGDLASKMEARELSRQLQDANSVASKERQDLLIQAIEVRGRTLTDVEKATIRAMSGAAIDTKFKDLLPKTGTFKAPRNRTRQEGRTKITEEESEYGKGDWRVVSEGGMDAPLKPRQPGKLSGPELASIGAGRENIRRLEQLVETTKDFNTGPAAARIDKLRRFTGIPNASRAVANARVLQYANQYIKSITGAAMSEAEAQRIITSLPTADLPDEDFQAMLEAALQDAKDTYNLGLDSMKRGGRDIGQFEPYETAPKASSLVEGKVMPDGRIPIFDSNTKKFVKYKEK